MAASFRPRQAIIRPKYIYFFPMPPHVPMNFRGFPPGCGDSVADF